MSVLFVSDLHLDAKRPDIAEQFLGFLENNSATADALYILGDLFESWIGDDDPQPDNALVATALRDFGTAGTPCYFICGNRDFLVGDTFAESAGLTLLDDEVLIDINDVPVLLMHGDSLCTDDQEYQAFRKTVRDRQWQQQFLSLPLGQRQTMAAEARMRSMTHNAEAPDRIMDVNQDAVEDAMRRHNVTTLLHGHTHRPQIHHFQIDGRPARRIVLGDWYEQGSMVCWGDDGPQLESLPR